MPSIGRQEEGHGSTAAPPGLRRARGSRGRGASLPEARGRVPVRGLREHCWCVGGRRGGPLPHRRGAPARLRRPSEVVADRQGPPGGGCRQSTRCGGRAPRRGRRRGGEGPDVASGSVRCAPRLGRRSYARGRALRPDQRGACGSAPERATGGWGRTHHAAVGGRLRRPGRSALAGRALRPAPPDHTRASRSGRPMRGRTVRMAVPRHQSGAASPVVRHGRLRQRREGTRAPGAEG